MNSSSNIGFLNDEIIKRKLKINDINNLIYEI